MSRKNQELTTKDRIIKATGYYRQRGFSERDHQDRGHGRSNGAAVNYHFGSKDAVINEALNMVNPHRRYLRLSKSMKLNRQPGWSVLSGSTQR